MKTILKWRKLDEKRWEAGLKWDTKKTIEKLIKLKKLKDYEFEISKISKKLYYCEAYYSYSKNSITSYNASTLKNAKQWCESFAKKL